MDFYSESMGDYKIEHPFISSTQSFELTSRGPTKYSSGQIITDISSYILG